MAYGKVSETFWTDQRVGWLRSEVEAWAKHRPLALANPEMAERVRR